jgi:hypothetical protein
MPRLPVRVFAVACAIGAFALMPPPALRAQAPQSPPAPPPAEPARGATITCEVFCSQTKLRTANARIRWSAPGSALRAAGIESGTAAATRLETTVFRDGFTKGLFVRLPIAGSGEVGILPLAEQPRQSQLRAYQIRVIEIAPPVRRTEAAGGDESGVVVEGLEPGVQYTWRAVIEAASRRVISVTATCEAPVCPADMVPEGRRER